MKIRKTGKSSKVNITFGERSEARKVDKIKSIKATSKIGRQITKGVYSGGRAPEDIKTIIIKFKGGYSKSTIRRHAKQGIESDEYYGYSLAVDPNANLTPKEVLNQVAMQMQQFDNMQPDKKAGSGAKNAAPRISEIEIEYFYR